MLFAVAEVATCNGHPDNKQRILSQLRHTGSQRKRNADSGIGSHTDVLLVGIDCFLGFRVNELQFDDAANSLFTRIDNSGTYGSLVALTNEARHVRLNHQVLFGHGFAR